MGVRKRVQEEFIHRFGESPALLIRAPGRVNLIGEHTDYNDGFVLPMAIDRAVWMALRPRYDRRVWISSLEMTTVGNFSLGHEPARGVRSHWVAQALFIGNYSSAATLTS